MRPCCDSISSAVLCGAAGWTGVLAAAGAALGAGAAVLAVAGGWFPAVRVDDGAAEEVAAGDGRARSG